MLAREIAFSLCPRPHATRRAAYEALRTSPLLTHADGVVCSHPAALCEVCEARRDRRRHIGYKPPPPPRPRPRSQQRAFHHHSECPTAIATAAAAAACQCRSRHRRAVMSIRGSFGVAGVATFQQEHPPDSHRQPRGVHTQASTEGWHVLARRAGMRLHAGLACACTQGWPVCSHAGLACARTQKHANAPTHDHLCCALHLWRSHMRVHHLSSRSYSSRQQACRSSPRLDSWRVRTRSDGAAGCRP